MKHEHEPELGQALFGQPYQFLECPGKVEDALIALQYIWDITRKEPNPFSNTGERFNGNLFQAHAYSWDEEEEQEFNFKWHDVRISWYKYLGRSTTISRSMHDSEITEMLKDCIKEILDL